MARLEHTGSSCDRCGKKMQPFVMRAVDVVWYEKGEKFDKVSSDIRVKRYRVVDLCPQCHAKFEQLMDKFKAELEVI